MKNILLAFILLLFPVFYLSAQSQTELPEGSKINLGVIVPLTGPLAFFGQDFVRTYDLAVEAHPEIKNTIQIFWEDSAYDSRQAIAAFNKLVSIDKADVVLSFGGPMLHAVAPIAEQKKIPFFATESEKSDCQGREYCTLFRNEEDEWGKATWHMLRKQGKKKVGIVKSQNQFMNTFVNAILRTKSVDEEVEIIADVPPDMTDLRSSILSLKSKNIDALGVFLLPGSHHGFLTAFRALNKKFPLFGVEEFLVEENNAGFEDLIEGALVVAPAATKEYTARFEEKYGQTAGFFYTPAFYDFFMLLADVISKNSQLRGLDLTKAMRFGGERSGVSGKYAMKVSEKGVHSCSFPIAIYKVTRDGPVVDEVMNF